MKKAIRKVSLDFTRKNNTRVSFASEADFGSREFIISFTDDGVRYFVNRNQTAIVNICRSDEGNRGYQAQITPEGCVDFILPLWALGVPGETRLSVSLYDGADSRLTSMPFVISVEKGLYLGNEITQDSDAYNLCQEMVNEMAKINAIEVARVEAEEKRKQSEEERRYEEGSLYSGDRYYGGRKVAELNRVIEENNRKSAEQARKSDEEKRVESEEERCYAEGSLYSGDIYYGGRKVAELNRQLNENDRISAEKTRVANENARIEMTETLMEALNNLITLQQTYIAKGEEV